MHRLGVLAALLLASSRSALAASADQWRGRTIYQVVTDRFARTDGSTTAACDTSVGDYCGGTWSGIVNQLDYIQNLGFDAIWISPITQQVQGLTADGSSYHGYWQNDINELNDAFGSAQDLQNLAAELHSRDMYLMVDIVVNHYAYIGAPTSVDYSTLQPFNDQSYYHDYCSIDFNAYTDSQIETCWMGDTIVPLPDLRTEDADVQSTFNTWISGLVSDYGIDGLRIDSVMEVNQEFWASFLESAGVYALGEVYVDDNDFICSYQDYMPGVFNYAMYYGAINAFSSTSGDISNFASRIDILKAGACQDTSLLGTFTENHDIPRFGALTPDMALAANALAFTMLTDGIPVVYQGQEQHYQAYGGQSTPYNREAVWLSGFNQDAELYVLVQKLNAARKNAANVDGTYLTYQNYHIYTDTSTIAMKKGDMVTVLTNAGADGASYTLNLASQYTGGTQVTELIGCTTSTVADDGTLAISMGAGAPKVFYPTDQASAVCGSSSKRRDLEGKHSAKWRF